MIQEASAALGAGWLDGQGWPQSVELGTALLLSACVGVEREIRGKDAGLRTHALVGLGSALFMVVSKYGFYDVAHAGLVVLDPSRMAAQIVSGIGFIGAGLIFVRKDAVRGLTTAASVWVTAAIGTAAGAGLLLLAAEVTAAYLVVTAVLLPLLARRLTVSFGRSAALLIRNPDGRGVLRRLLHAATDQGFIIDELSAEPLARQGLFGPARPGDGTLVEVRLRVHGRSPVSALAAALSEIDDVAAVVVGDEQDAA